MAQKSKLEWIKVKLKAYLITLSILSISIVTYLLTTSSQNNYAKALNVIALGMIPACLIGVLWEAFVKHEFIEFIQAEVSSGSELHKSGIRGVFPNRVEINLHEHIRKARRRVWILVTSFNYLTDTPGLLDALVLKAKQGVELRLLGLNPHSQSAELRVAFNPIYKSLREEIAFSVEKLFSELKKVRRKASRVHVKHYDKIPTCVCFIIDDDAFVSPLLCHKRGRNSVHLHISKSPNSRVTPLFDEYESHFAELFNGANLIDDIGPHS